jgi:hypothetical protein
MTYYLVEKKYLFRVKAKNEAHAVQRVDDPEDTEGEIVADETVSVTETSDTD